MINHFIFFLLSVFIKSSNVVICVHSYGDIQLAFDSLTDPNVYKKWIRPPIENDLAPRQNTTGPLFVNVSIDLYNYATIDEITSEYTFHLFLDMEWFDPRLKFIIEKGTDEYDEPVIEGGNYHIDRIWYPSVFIPNNQDPGSFDYDNQSANFVKIKSTGYVWLRKRKLLRVYCNMDFHLYPFDEQMCFLHLESSISTVNNLKLRWNPKIAFSKAESFRTIGFNLRDYETIITEKTYSKNNSFSRVSLKFTLVREWAHHMFLFYLPTAIIVIASWASFWLEITSPPARVSIGVTTMLALVTTFKSTKLQLPSVSYWNAIDIWNMVCIVFIFAVLMEFACVNYIFNTEKRRKKNKKMKRNRAKSVLAVKEVLTANLSRKSSIGAIDPFYSSTVSTLNELNKKLSDLSGHRKKESDITKKAIQALQTSKSKLISVGIDLMPDIKEDEPTDCRQRRQSLRSRAGSTLTPQVLNELCYKLTPQELANDIDRKCRRIFPISFLFFNLIYWTVLLIRL